MIKLCFLYEIIKQMNERCSINLGLTQKQQKTESQTVLDYRKCSKLAKGKSLLIYMLQSVVCFLLLGPLISIFLFQLWKYFGQHSQQQFLASGDILLAAPIGFALSLLLDRYKAPPKSCLPLSKIRMRCGNFFIPNRTFFGQPGCEPMVFFGKKRSSLFWFWLSLILGMLFLLCSNILILLLTHLFPNLPTFQIDEVSQIFANYSNLEVFLIVVIFPVIFEELVYRGRGFALLARYWGTFNAFVISSLIFAFSHASPIEIISLLPLAFYLGWIRWRTGNLAFAMLVHLQNNGLAFLWQLSQ